MFNFIQCHFCPAQWQVSRDDPNSAMEDALEHLQEHPQVNPAEMLHISDVSRT